MAGFDVIYKQTITLFNRSKTADDDLLWLPTVINGVHLIISKAAMWNNYGGNAMDSVQLNVRYQKNGNGIIVAGKTWYEPKMYSRLSDKSGAITFAYGNDDNFDFFVEGVVEDYLTPVHDSDFERKGFYNHINARYDNVFAISSVSKRDIIPHFEIMAR